MNPNEKLVITDPQLIALIRQAAQTGTMVTARADRAKALRRLDTLAVRVLAWINAHGHGTIADVSRELNADVSSVTRAAWTLLSASQIAMLYEPHEDSAGQRRRRLRLLQPKRVSVDLSSPAELSRRQPSH